MYNLLGIFRALEDWEGAAKEFCGACAQRGSRRIEKHLRYKIKTNAVSWYADNPVHDLVLDSL